MANNLTKQTKLQRIILLTVLALEGIGGILGGVLLLASPDGKYMELEVTMMNGTFSDFLIPGFMLTFMGVLTSTAFVFVLKKMKYDWLLAAIALVGYVIWFVTEIIILQELHWLHIVWGTPVLVGIWALIPIIPKTSSANPNKPI